MSLEKDLKKLIDNPHSPMSMRSFLLIFINQLQIDLSKRSVGFITKKILTMNDVKDQISFNYDNFIRILQENGYQIDESLNDKQKEIK